MGAVFDSLLGGFRGSRFSDVTGGDEQGGTKIRESPFSTGVRRGRNGCGLLSQAARTMAIPGS